MSTYDDYYNPANTYIYYVPVPDYTKNTLSELVALHKKGYIKAFLAVLACYFRDPGGRVLHGTGL